MTYSVQARLVL